MPQFAVPIPALRDALERCLRGCTLAGADASRIVDVLLDCELRGYDDHGVAFLNILTEGYRSGGVNPRARPRVVREDRAGVLVDGDAGSGVLGATLAMERCIALAMEHGMAAAALHRSAHFVAAAPYAVMAAEAGLIGFACSNTPPLMPPAGGLTRVLGTNPLAYAIPAARHDFLVMDMATSATAGFKVRMAAKEGRQLPPGLIADRDGRPSTDPNDFVNGGLILPVGGYKGYGLAQVVDVLAGVLTGAGFALGAGLTHGKGGQFFWALDPALFMPRDEFLARVDAEIDQIKSSALAPGATEVLVPGERGQRRRRRLLEAGVVPLGAVSRQTLDDECRRAGVPSPAYGDMDLAV